MADHVNVGMRLRAASCRNPGKLAVAMCKGPGESSAFSMSSITFGDLDRDSDAAARGFEEAGIVRGVKTLVMLKPSVPFFSCFFGLLKVGAVPVVIDPGMGIKRLLECIRDANPAAMVGIPAAHAIRVLLPRYFRSMTINITLGRRWFWGGRTWDGFKKYADAPYAIAETSADELCAILFTTGSTGPAKGVEYTHGALNSQVGLIAEALKIDADDVDAATFPGFSLFSIALGMTAVVPDMNPTRPGSVYPPNIETPINAMHCTFSFGSPALWKRVSRHAAAEKITLPSLKKVIMAGAPVPTAVHERLLGNILAEGAETYTPYGATEVMPVSNMRGSEALAETAALTAQGKGVCVGKPVPGLRAEIITISDAPLAEWSDALLVSPGEIGEIAVQADHVSQHYHNLPAADRLAKIRDGKKFWHRMGDVGYKDEKGRLWFCGRKSHRVTTAAGTLFTIPCEAVFNQHPAVARSALVGVPGADGFSVPVMVVELEKEHAAGDSAAIARELAEIARQNSVTAAISHILFHPAFPVDIRHNAKIRREDLALWAAKRF